MATAPSAVLHDTTAGAAKFYAVMDDGAQAVLEYSLTADGVMDLTHTFCPPSARGKGMAAKLADAAFAWARDHGVASVRPSCSYIRDSYLPKAGAACGFVVAPGATDAVRVAH